MTKKEYVVTITTEYIMEIDDSVISAVDDEWRSVFYPLDDEEEIVRHITYNLARGYRLSQLDGWANHSDDEALCVSDEIVDLVVDIEEK